MAFADRLYLAAVEVPSGIPTGGLPGQAILEGAAGKIASQDGATGALLIIALFVIAFLCWVIRGLYREIRECGGATLSDRDKVVAALQSAADAANRGIGVSEALKSTLETRGHAVDELTHLVDKSFQDIRHQINNVAQALEGVVRFLDRDRGREWARDRDRDRSREDERGTDRVERNRERGMDRDERHRERDEDRGRP